jgi:hypothetical protein
LRTEIALTSSLRALLTLAVLAHMEQIRRMWTTLVSRVLGGAAQAAAVAWPWLRYLVLLAIWLVRGPLWRAAVLVLQTLAAFILLFEEWGWRPLAAALKQLSKYVVWARLEAWIVSLPAYGALALFAAPAVCLFPLKLFALYLFATGHPVLGVALIAGAKIVGTAIVARIFILTQPKLMQIGWFATIYNTVMPWKERMFAQIRQSAAWRYGRIARVVAKREAGRLWTQLKPWRVWGRAKFGALRTQLNAQWQGLRTWLGRWPNTRL